MKYRVSRTNKLFLPIAAIVLLFSSFFFFAPTAVAADKVVNIGFLNPETGSLSGQAEGFKNAFNLALAELEKEDGWNFTSTIKDTGTGDDTKTTAAADALVAAGVHGVVGAASSSSSITAIAKFKAQKISQISYASTSPALSNATLDDGYFFRVVLSDALQGVELSDLLNKQNVTKVGVIHLNDAYGTGLSSAFKASFDKISDNHSVVIESSYDQNSFTASDVVSPIVTNADKIEAIVLVTFVTDGAAILKEIEGQATLADHVLYGTDGIGSTSLFEETDANTTDAIQRLRGVRPATVGEVEGSNFTAELKAAYNTTPDIFDREVYDATLLLGKAIIAANPVLAADTTPSDAEKELIRTKITELSKTITGTATGNITLNDVGDRIEGDYETWQIFYNETAEALQFGAVGDIKIVNLGADPTTSASSATSASETTSDSPFGVLSFIGAFGIVAVSIVAIVTLRRRS